MVWRLPWISGWERGREREKDPWREASVGSAMRFLMASFHLCGRRAEHTAHVAVWGIIHLVLVHADL